MSPSSKHASASPALSTSSPSAKEKKSVVVEDVNTAETEAHPSSIPNPQHRAPVPSIPTHSRPPHTSPPASRLSPHTASPAHEGDIAKTGTVRSATTNYSTPGRHTHPFFAAGGSSSYRSLSRRFGGGGNRAPVEDVGSAAAHILKGVVEGVDAVPKG